MTFFKKRHRNFRSGWKLVWMFIFLIVSMEKRVGDSDSSLHLWAGTEVSLHPVLFFALQQLGCSLGRLCLLPPTLALSFQEGSQEKLGV